MNFDIFRHTNINSEQRQLRLAIICIYTVLTSNFIAIIALSISDFGRYHLFIIETIFYIILLSIPLILFKKNKIVASKIFLMLFAPIQIILCSIFFFGSESLIHFYLIPYATLFLMIWPIKQIWYGIPALFVNIGIFLFIHFVDLSHTHIYAESEKFIEILSDTSIIASFIILGMFIIWYQSSTYLYEDRIRMHRAELIEANEKLTSQNDIINESNTQLEERQQRIEEQSEELMVQKEELEKINEVLQELSVTKDKFFSIVAHDLKNPLANIIGFSDLLLHNFSKYTADKQQKMVNLINTGAKQTYKMLENLLVWARIQMQGITVTPETIQLTGLVEECLQNIENMALKKGIQLKSNISNDLIIESDKHILSFVINNLLTNAIKFTPRNGMVEIFVKKAGNNLVQICVSDTGIGMAEMEIKKLFKIDKNVSTEGTDHEKGTGLGLLLCNEFIGKLGGKILVESTKNKGSNFCLEINGEP